jgi:hypothetical protein
MTAFLQNTQEQFCIGEEDLLVAGSADIREDKIIVSRVYHF